eukprot:scaffold138154_cov17-Tisochrysis_lutea.AAC.1
MHTYTNRQHLQLHLQQHPQTYTYPSPPTHIHTHTASPAAAHARAARQRTPGRAPRRCPSTALPLDGLKSRRAAIPERGVAEVK